MLTRRRLFAGAILALLPAGAVAAPERWSRYRNARFGTTIAYQDGFAPGEEPTSGDGRVFTSAEAEFRVFGQHNIDGATAETRLAEVRADPEYSGLSYEAITGRRLTVSGRRGDRIFYEAYLFAPTGTIHTFLMEYPAARKEAYDSIVVRMARSFGGP